MKWSYNRYLRLRLDCGLDPYFRLLGLRKRRREEKKARLFKKIGRPRIWTLRQAASAINSWGIDHGNFPRLDRFRDLESYRKRGFPAGGLGDLQHAVLVDARDDVSEPCAPIRLTDAGVDLLSNRQ